MVSDFPILQQLKKHFIATNFLIENYAADTCIIRVVLTALAHVKLNTISDGNVVGYPIAATDLCNCFTEQRASLLLHSSNLTEQTTFVQDAIKLATVSYNTSVKTTISLHKLAEFSSLIQQS